MATLECEGTIKEIQDGEGLQETCEAFGIPFACHSGVCGTCQVEIVEGKENLTPLTEMEQELGMDEDNRFACQCKIKGGHVKIKY